MRFVATVGGREEVAEITGADGQYRLTIGEAVWDVDAHRTGSNVISLLIDGVSYVVTVSPGADGTVVAVGGETYLVQVEEATRHLIRTRGGTAAAGGGVVLKAPLPGKITHVAVRPGDRVDAGDALVVIEAMKMENELRAGAAGTVAEVRVAAGEAVNPGDVLVVLAPA